MGFVLESVAVSQEIKFPSKGCDRDGAEQGGVGGGIVSSHTELKAGDFMKQRSLHL